MYNKYIFINNNRRKKQKELEEQKKLEENSQISFDMIANAQNIDAAEKEENIIFQTEEIKKKQNTNKRGKSLNKFIDDYVLVDIETTGLSPIYDDIIEIGAIK